MLMIYGASNVALFKRAGYFVDKMLKGATPVDLPVEQPTVIELIINLKTAKALGNNPPPDLVLWHRTGKVNLKTAAAFLRAPNGVGGAHTRRAGIQLLFS